MREKEGFEIVQISDISQIVVEWMNRLRAFFMRGLVPIDGNIVNDAIGLCAESGPMKANAILLLIVDDLCALLSLKEEFWL